MPLGSDNFVLAQGASPHQASSDPPSTSRGTLADPYILVQEHDSTYNIVNSTAWRFAWTAPILDAFRRNNARGVATILNSVRAT
jgi:hypothetical protein